MNDTIPNEEFEEIEIKKTKGTILSYIYIGIISIVLIVAMIFFVIHFTGNTKKNVVKSSAEVTKININKKSGSNLVADNRYIDVHNKQEQLKSDEAAKKEGAFIPSVPLNEGKVIKFEKYKEKIEEAKAKEDPVQRTREAVEKIQRKKKEIAIKRNPGRKSSGKSPEELVREERLKNKRAAIKKMLGIIQYDAFTNDQFEPLLPSIRDVTDIEDKKDVSGEEKKDKNKVLLAQALKPYYGRLNVALNSDRESLVFATLAQGNLSGARIAGSFSLSNESIQVSLNKMHHNGKDYTVNAVILDPENNITGLTGDVDNHYLERMSAMFFGSILMSAGEVATTFSQASAASSGYGAGSATVNEDGVEVTVPLDDNKLDASDISTGVAGSMATNIGNEIYEGSNKEPTVTVPHNKEVMIVFLNSVYEKEE